MAFLGPMGFQEGTDWVEMMWKQRFVGSPVAFQGPLTFQALIGNSYKLTIPAGPIDVV